MRPHYEWRFAVVVATAAVHFDASNASAQPVLAPAEVSACPGHTAFFTVTPPGSGPYSFQWQLQISPGAWATLGNDPMPLPCGGGAFAFASNPFSNQTPIGVHPCAGVHSYEIRCVLTNAQGSLVSNSAILTLCCPGDIDCDGAVNIDDLLAVIGAWGQCAQPCPPHCAADLNYDCTVNVDDLLAVISNWD